MSDFSACSVSSDYRMTINDDTAANASSKCYHDQVFFSFSGTLPVPKVSIRTETGFATPMAYAN